jgi:hypothetical protein
MSLFINAVAKPGLKSLLAGDVGPGRAQGNSCDRPAVARRAGDHVEQRLRGQAQLLGQHEGFPGRDLLDASTMLLHSLAAWPVPEAPQ